MLFLLQSLMPDHQPIGWDAAVRRTIGSAGTRTHSVAPVVSRLLGWLQLSLTLIATGCSAKETSEVKVEALPGAVDTSLPMEAQLRQQALVDIFRTLQLAGEFSELPTTLPNIRFREKMADFYGEANVLDHWEWDGAPAGNDVPVKLVMLKVGQLSGSVEYRRVYTVARHGKQFIVARKS